MSTDATSQVAGEKPRRLSDAHNTNASAPRHVGPLTVVAPVTESDPAHQCVDCRDLSRIGGRGLVDANAHPLAIETALSPHPAEQRCVILTDARSVCVTCQREAHASGPRHVCC